MQPYDVAIIGAGPAGVMAALSSRLNSNQIRKIILIERNDTIARKLLLTGRGRCNITNAASIDAFIEIFGREGNFLRPAFSGFFNENLISFFKSKGLKMRRERQGRIFPVTDNATSVVEILKRYIKECDIELRYNARLVDIKKKDGLFELVLENRDRISARNAVLSTGGVSFKMTGSTGDGLSIARRLGHTITPLLPALVPLKTKEAWVRQLAGLTLKNIRILFEYDKKKIVSDVGELLFTHFGVSGPLILDLSGRVVSILKTRREVSLYIDLKPGLKPEQLDKRLLTEFAVRGSVYLKNAMKTLLPNRLTSPFIRIADLDPQKRLNQITQEERRSIVSLLKRLPLTIVGSLPVEEAMVTAGGISTKEINPKTMESRVVPGLYFAGEIIAGCGPSGGYNLQQAFSTGCLAGKSAAICLQRC